jgi:hypothetical protein
MYAIKVDNLLEKFESFVAKLMTLYIIIIISLCLHCWGTGLFYGIHIMRTSHNPPRGPTADWRLLTTAYSAGINGLTYLPKHEGAQAYKF